MTKNLSPFFIIAVVLHAGLVAIWGINFAVGTPGKVGRSGTPGKSGASGRPGNPEPIRVTFSQQKIVKDSHRPIVKHSVSSNVLSTSVESSGIAGENGQGGEGGEGGQNGEFGDGSRGKVDVVALYKAELRAKIESNKFYPPLSRRLGQMGTVIVSFTVTEDGRILNIQIDQPTQFARLNDSALEAVRKVMQFRPIPSEFGSTTMNVKIPIKFVTI